MPPFGRPARAEMVASNVCSISKGLENPGAVCEQFKAFCATTECESPYWACYLAVWTEMELKNRVSAEKSTKSLLPTSRSIASSRREKYIRTGVTLCMGISLDLSPIRGISSRTRSS